MELYVLGNWLHVAYSVLENCWCLRTAGASGRTTGASGSRVFLCFLCSLKCYYCVHKILPFVPVLSHMCWVHILLYSSLKKNVDIVLPSMPGPSKWSLSLRLSPPNPHIEKLCMLHYLYLLLLLSSPCTVFSAMYGLYIAMEILCPKEIYIMS